jgi:glycosyltransferase involved in cell wall biosynthesis
MKISIITPTYNSQKTIKNTIDSIVSQTYNNIEIIVVDGLSNDKTLDIIKEYLGSCDLKFISEKDAGVYDAMNKGIKMTSGEIVGILNSDDFYIDDQVLSDVVDVFENNKDTDIVYGDIVYVDQDDVNKITRVWRAGGFSFDKIKNGWAMPHPAVFVRKKVYEEFGVFRNDLRIAADYEIMLRWFLSNKLKFFYLKRRLTIMREGGLSGRDLKHRRSGWKELKKAWLVNNQKIPTFFIFRRVFGKIGQYMLKKKE